MNTDLHKVQSIILEMFLEKNLTEAYMKEKYPTEHSILTTIFGTVLWND